MKWALNHHILQIFGIKLTIISNFHSPEDDSDMASKAHKKDLYDIPSEQVKAVDALRRWVRQQPHINAPTGRWYS